MSDWGMKVSRQGYPVTEAADHQLLFTSAFKVPLIIQSGLWINPDKSQDQVLATHNLGFKPLVLFYMRTGSEGIYVVTDWTDPDDPGVFITDTNIRYLANSHPENVRIAYFITNINIETDYTAPIINNTSASQGTFTQDYGFKVSKSGYDVKTAGLNDLSSFSGASLGGSAVRHQLIHKIGGGTVSQSLIGSFAHGLGYAPMFLFYRKYLLSGNTYWYPSMSNYEGSGGTILIKIRTYADNTNIYFDNQTSGDQEVRYVIFKDPLF